ncbi:hypothetical protein [Herbaspirillum huttiense]|uniref:hypothetical protein n=1 Tax=Herbaspirillum huttiense TaxID=863372 RepID=UPI0031DC98A6
MADLPSSRPAFTWSPGERRAAGVRGLGWSGEEQCVLLSLAKPHDLPALRRAVLHALGASERGSP